MDEPLPPAPAPWTLDFHLRFIPVVVAKRLGMGQPQRSGFSSFNLGAPLAFVVCVALLGNGVVDIVDHDAPLGAIVIATLGGGGLAAMIAMSVLGELGTPASWERFEPALLCFCLVFGATAGLFTTHLFLKELAPASAWGVEIGAALAGYAVGLVLGFWWQKLGTIGAMFAYLAWLASLGMIVVDLVITSG